MFFKTQKDILVKYFPSPNETEVVVPNFIREIGESAFENCKTLKKVVIPQNVRTIRSAAFKNCTSLVEVELKYGLREILWEAFWGCSSLKEIVIPDSVIVLGVAAFTDCSSLTYVVISKRLINISRSTFLGTPWFENYLGDFIVVNGILLKYKGNESDLTIPDNINTINMGAFDGVDSLVNVVIPESVTQIRGKAFSNCRSLKSVTIPKSVTKFGLSIFENNESLEKVSVWEYDVCVNGKELEFFNVQRITSIISKGDFKVAFLPDWIKHQIIAQMLIKNENKKSAEEYIRQNIVDVVFCLIDYNCSELLRSIFEYGDFITQNDIMKFVDHSINNTKNGGDPFIQIYISNYRYEHFPDIDDSSTMLLLL